MTAWETEDESSGPMGAASLPTPTETPYRSSSRGSRGSRGSKKSRRSITPPASKSSPPPMTNADKSDKAAKRFSKDITMNESISVLDPRRFTPTLHANLVSEILTLRRDQEEKLKIIESLETSLHTSHQDQETLQTNLTTTNKENRSLKRQLQLLEGGTSSALGELARERDEAVDSASDTKRRVDNLQRKVRVQEEDSQRVHQQWAEEKDSWADEKRKFERKVHVAESRLKVVLDEVAAYQAAQLSGQAAQESEVDEPQTDTASVRSMSMTNSVRFSVVNGHGSMKPMNGNSLADELNMDGDDDWQTDHDGRESVLSNHFHARNMSRDSNYSRTHFRNQSVESLVRPGSVARGRLYANHSVLEKLEGGIREDDETQGTITPRANYVDSGVQYSPPPSPGLPASMPCSPEPPILMARAERLIGVESAPKEWEVEANQGKKRVQINRPPPIEPPTLPRLMVSSGSQTIEQEPLSPPRTPKSPLTPELPIVPPRSPTRAPPPPPPHPIIVEPPKPVMADSCTQTDRPMTPPPSPTPTLPPPPPPVSMLPPIPSISIIPPTSRPTTPREPRLPQHLKDVGCQVMMPSLVSYTSSSVQTEEIRIDQRLNLLPPHLHPSAISSRPHSPDVTAIEEFEENRQFTPLPGNLPPRNPRRLMNRKSVNTDAPPSPRSSADIVETHDAYPGNNDDGPLSSEKAPMRRPHRISSLFAGFDGNSSDEVDEFGDGEASDTEYRTALTAPRPKSTATRPAQRSSVGTNATSPEQPPSNRQSWGRSSARFGGTEVYSKYSLDKRDSLDGTTRRSSSRAFEKSVMGSNRASVMRKSAMIQSGIASHGRSRSPSLPDNRDPPFPIPTRASSRRPPMSVSAPSDGQRSPTRMSGDVWHRRGIGRSHYRANSIRKTRSAAALPRNQRYPRQGSRSPTPISPSIESPESPHCVPPMPNNEITTPRGRESSNGSRYKMHRPQNSTNTANTGDTGVGSVGSSNPATGVVDAIAQTMVGEWMYKYVRRRKSFGVPDSVGKDDNSNDRHKRWVWLAPYERAILWSSKQPASGSALMGKSGRKLTIQSVLDVKDDNLTPKGAPQLFNRSILILTPQRALKFTATSADRHYLWLTSLSFLAHSSQAVPEIVQQPSTQQQPQPPQPPLPPQKLPQSVPELEAPKPKTRKSGIRDSIRLAKGRGLTKQTAPVNIPSPPPPVDMSLYQQPDPFIPPIPPPTHTRDPSYEVAEPPFIPRFPERASHSQGAAHGRKRSNTGGHVPPPLSFRGFSGPAGSGSTYHGSTNSTAGASIVTAGSSDIYQSHASTSGGTNGTMWAMSTTSGRTSEASSRPGNFFDAIGTVRMEAFISPLAFTRVDDSLDEHEELRHLARRRSKEIRRRKSRSRQRDSYASRGMRTTTDEYGYAGSEDFFRDDPFKGF